MENHTIMLHIGVKTDGTIRTVKGESHIWKVCPPFFLENKKRRHFFVEIFFDDVMKYFCKRYQEFVKTLEFKFNQILMI